MITERQKECLEKARKHQRSGFLSWEYGRNYLRFVEDGHVPAREFNRLARNQDNVIQFRAKEPEAFIELPKYFDICKKRYLRRKHA